MKTKTDALNILNEYVNDKGLKRHCFSVSLAMGFYATRLGEDPEYWEIVGLLHDFDWEIHPNLDLHPMQGAILLREQGWNEETIRVIQSHYTEGTGVKQEKPIDFALLACDEITGLIIATALVRPSKNIGDVTLKSIRKKWKDKRFAAGVDRDHVTQVTADFSLTCFDADLTLWDHISNVLLAMQNGADLLELDGRLAS